MSKNKIDYSQKSFPKNRLPVGIDFSKTNEIKYESTKKDSEIKDQIKEASAELVSFTRVDKTVRPKTSKVQLGSYISKNNLQTILHKNQKDRSYYAMLDYLRKNDKGQIAIQEDFDLLRDFFPTALVSEVRDYLDNIIKKIVEYTVSAGSQKLTPRKRRGYILAIFRSICRRNGRRFTEELLDEINKRFGYQRCIKLFEVCKAENQLIAWKLLTKKPERKENDLRVFYLNSINNINALKQHPKISENSDYMKIIGMTQKHVTRFVTSKEHKKELCRLIKHQDKDFISRLIFWSIAKEIAEKKFDIKMTNPEEIPGWKSLFLISTNIKEEIPIRSFKFIFWSEFSLRKKLKEGNFFPEL